jgi:hypothetical protein
MKKKNLQHLHLAQSKHTVLALIFLVPAIGDRDDLWNVGGGKEVRGKAVQPDWVGLNPEPALRAQRHAQDVLDVQRSLQLWIGRIIVTNDARSSDWRDWDGEGAGKVLQVGWREVLLLEFDDTNGDTCKSATEQPIWPTYRK